MSQDNKKRGAEENPNQARTTYYINIIFLCALTLVSLIFSLIVYFRLRTAGSDGIRKMYTEKQIGNIREGAAETGRKELLLQIQTALESGRSTTSMLQEVFEDSIVVVRDGKYYFYPVAAGVEKSALEPGALRNGGDRVVYTGDLPGIEVSCGVLLSEENGKVDWGRLSESDVEETAVLAGTVTAKGFFTDAQFARNCRKAVEKGMKIRLCVDLMEPADGEALAEAARAVRDAFEEYGIQKSTLDIFADGADADAQEDAGDIGGLEPAVIVRLAAPDHGDAVSESGDSLGEAADAAAAAAMAGGGGMGGMM